MSSEETTELFAGSLVSHGTYNGWTKHKTLGEQPCDACYRAKQEDDRRLKSALVALDAAMRSFGGQS